jgi:hypothetical protein
MNEPEEVARSYALIQRGRLVVEEQRQRVARLQATGASSEYAEKVLVQFISTLSALEDHSRLLRAEMRRRLWL